MRLLVTGGAGFIGANFVRYWLEEHPDDRVVVFGSFALTGVPTIKEIGVGLASAIAIDATLTRLVLVPATMRLLGDWNWWLPRWLDRRLPQLAHEVPAAGD